MPTNLHHQVNDIDTIVHGLSMLIRESLTAYENKRTHPMDDADRMDDKIEFYKTRVNKLRLIRDEFENEIARTY